VDLKKKQNKQTNHNIKRREIRTILIEKMLSL
jgi:hypothetical protein